MITNEKHYKKIVETMLSDTEHNEELRTDPSKTDKIKYSIKFILNNNTFPFNGSYEV